MVKIVRKKNAHAVVFHRVRKVKGMYREYCDSLKEAHEGL